MAVTAVLAEYSHAGKAQPCREAVRRDVASTDNGPQSCTVEPQIAKTPDAVVDDG